jgi:carboxyl-terminal processing protease
MKMTNVILSLALALSFTAGTASAQISKPQSLTPPGATPGNNSITVPKDGQPEDDEIVVIPGPKIGKAEKPQITPQMFEMLYRAIWLKVSKEYQDPFKLKNWAEWENKYKGKLKSEEDLDAAVKEMLGSLHDRWTIYYSPSDIADQQKAAKDGVLSAGMLLRKHSDNAWHIDGMQFNTPAMHSVLREGDVIKAINGKSLDTLSQSEVSKLLSGKEGDKLSVLAFFDGKDQTVELTLAPQGENEVMVGIMPGNIAYIRLPTFVNQQTVQEFVQALTKVYAASEGQINGLVLDLRYNSGGLVTMALAVSSMFLEKGEVTATTTRSDRSLTDTHYKVIPVPDYLAARMPAKIAEFQQFLATVPMVVLTNGSTASASEITTGALKDNKRAFVIGVRTFGKAVGFTDTPMPNGGVLQVTNLTYLTPNGTNIADKGIEPDQVVEQPRGKPILSESDEQVKAAHEHLLKIAQERAKQLADAQNLSTKPQRDENAPQKHFVIQPLHIMLGTLGGGSVLLVCIYLVSSYRRKRIYQ